MAIKKFISLAKVFIVGLIFFFIGLLVSFYVVIKKFESELPDIEILRSYQPSLVSRVYSDNQQVLAEFFLEKRILVPLSKIPKYLVDATIIIEDERFFQHRGVDLVGILRALKNNIMVGKIVEGGSTITQQLAKNLFLKHELYQKIEGIGEEKHKVVYQRKMSRKIKEILLALKIEKLYSKNEILQMYFNEIFYGHSYYGVEAAAIGYFGKHINELNLTECAAIAALPKAPNTFSPRANPEKNRERRNMIISLMAQKGLIDATEEEEAKIREIVVISEPKREVIAPYFIEHIRKKLERQFSTEAVHRGGLSVYTKLNIKLQLAAEKALKEGLRHLDKRQGFRGPLSDEQVGRWVQPKGLREGEIYLAKISSINENCINISINDIEGVIERSGFSWTNKKDLSSILKPGDYILARLEKVVRDVENQTERYLFSLDQEPEVEGALIAMDAKTGDILAWVGGYNFDRSKFDRVFQAKRQPGSAFKPFIYTAALDNGFTPASIIYDSPVIEEKVPELAQQLQKLLEEGKGLSELEDFNISVQKEYWKPSNYGATFYGPTTLREALEQSRNVVTVKLLDKIGVNKALAYVEKMGINSEIPKDLSIALGSFSISLYDLTAAYTSFPNLGIKVEPRDFYSITNWKKEEIFYKPVVRKRVVDDQVASLMLELLKGVIEKGTAQRAKSLGRYLGGKTGTTNNFQDAWFIGFSPDIVAGVWVGFDDVRSLGSGEAGAKAALPIWIEFMKVALKDKPNQPFKKADGIIYVAIDAKSGLLATSQCQNIINEAFIAGTEPQKLCDIHFKEQEQFYFLDQVDPRSLQEQKDLPVELLSD